ncbi:T9SS type A sorting domain-containing protein [Cryomorphaceae bacterium 1068]|nr:T9SS type A sorting domain-containing protein [Cryomorphaceae bacterium 1068]
MKSYLIAICCLFSATLFSQNPGVIVQIDLFNPPQEPVIATVDFIGSTETESYTVFLNDGLFSTFYFDPQITWGEGLVHIEDCNGDSLFDSFANIDSTGYYYTSFFYCESDSILGCTDPSALNFNSFATIDDGSCIYTGPENDLCSGAQPLEQGTILIDNSFATQNEGIFGECWNFGSGEGEQSSLWFTFTTPATPAQISIEAIGDGSWTLTDTQFGLFTECGGEMIYCDGNSGEGLLSAFEFSCGELDTNATYLLMVDGWNGDAGTCFLEYEVTNPCAEPLFGCTDPSAANFNPDATVDDGSCIYDCTEVYLGFDFFGGAPQDSSFMSWTITNDFGEIVEDGFFYNWAPQYDLCLGDGCYSLNIYNIDPDWAGIYSIFILDQSEYFGEFDGSSNQFTVQFGVNNTECGEPVDIEGCTDPTALNYNPSATIDDGSCEYFECENNEVIVLINTQNWGYEISWNIRNDEGDEVAGSGDYPSYSTITELACLEDGCYTFELFDSFGDGWNDGTFELILNGNTLVSGTLEDGEFGSVPFGVNAEGCEEVVLGCTDPEALNYNPDATEDDGSCEYFECENNEVMVVVFTENWGYEISWNIRNEEGDEVAGSGDYPNYSTITESTCLENGCYTFELFDSFGDGWNGGSFQVILNNNILASGTLADGEFGSVAFGVNTEGCEEEVFGCTDPLAINYSPEATIDDGSCQYACTEVYLGFDFLDGAPDDSSFTFMNWVILNQFGEQVASDYFYNWAPQYNLCLETGCYTFAIYNVSPDWNGIYNIIMFNEVLASGEFSGADESFQFNFGVNEEGCGDPQEIYGCTDPEALNYNPAATVDDGSCEYEFECGISFDVIADSTGENTFYIIPSDNIVNASSVLWDFGDGGTSNEYYPTHIYEDDGPYVLCLFVTFGDSIGNLCQISYCEVLDGSALGGSGVLSGGFNINVIQPGTLSDNIDFAEKEIAVYPNPTNDLTTISYQSDRSEELTLRVTDLTGKVLKQRVLSSSIGQQKIQVDLSEFPQGIYLIGLEQKGSSSYAKVVRR